MSKASLFEKLKKWSPRLNAETTIGPGEDWAGYSGRIRAREVDGNGRLVVMPDGTETWVDADKLQRPRIMESPVREYDVEVPGCYHDAGGACFSVTDRVNALNADDAGAKIGKRYSKKNDAFYNEGKGNKTYEPQFSKVIEYQGPGLPVTDEGFRNLVDKYKVKF